MRQKDWLDRWVNKLDYMILRWQRNLEWTIVLFWVTIGCFAIHVAIHATRSGGPLEAAFLPKLIGPATKMWPIGPIPDECKAWESIPTRPLPPEKVGYVPGERNDRMPCQESVYPDGHTEPGECFPFSLSNVQQYATDNLWRFYVDGKYHPNAGGFDCLQLFTANYVRCSVFVNDLDGNQIEIVHVTCKGDKVCDNCCFVNNREKTFVPRIDPTQEQIQKWNREAYERRVERFETCKPYCTDARYIKKCASYWNYVGSPDKS